MAYPCDGQTLSVCDLSLAGMVPYHTFLPTHTYNNSYILKIIFRNVVIVILVTSRVTSHFFILDTPR